MLKQNVPIEGITLKSKLTILRFLNSSYEMELFSKSYEVISKVQRRISELIWRNRIYGPIKIGDLLIKYNKIVSYSIKAPPAGRVD